MYVIGQCDQTVNHIRQIAAAHAQSYHGWGFPFVSFQSCHLFFYCSLHLKDNGSNNNNNNNNNNNKNNNSDTEKQYANVERKKKKRKFKSSYNKEE